VRGAILTFGTTKRFFSDSLHHSAPRLGCHRYSIAKPGTAATVAARSGDPFAVQRLLGHVDLKMATRYVQDVSEQTDRVICSLIVAFLPGPSHP